MHPTVSSQTCKTEAVYGEGVFLVSLTKVHASAPSQQDRKTHRSLCSISSSGFFCDVQD